MGLFQVPGTEGVTPEPQREPVDTPSEPWKYNNLSHPRSNTSLKVEHPATFRLPPLTPVALAWTEHERESFIYYFQGQS